MGRHPSRRHASADDAPVGRRIRGRRRELGLTQATLASPEYTKSFISQVESGLADPSLDSLRFLSRRLQTSLSLIAGDPADQRLAAVEGLLEWGREASRTREPHLARRVLEAAVEMAAVAGLRGHQADAQLLLAELEIDAGDAGRAASLLEHITDDAITLGPSGPARKHLAAGLLGLRNRADEAAAVSFQAALAGLGKTTRHAALAARALLGLATALERTGNLKQARRQAQAASRLAVKSRLAALHGRAQGLLARLAMREGSEEAYTLLRSARIVLEGTDDVRGLLDVLILLARASLRAGDAVGALEVSSQAMTAAGPLEDATLKARVSGVTGRALLRLGRTAEAVSSLTEAIALMTASGEAGELAEAAAELGDLHRSRGEHDLASRYAAVAAEAVSG